MIHARLRRGSLVLLLALFAARSAGAQTAGHDSQRPLPEYVRQVHMVHVSPHLIVFDPSTKSATLEFSDIGDIPTEAEVAIQLGYTVWQNTDTALFPSHPQERAHDTVIVNPGPRSHYVGVWLSGLPTVIRLKPHEIRRVTLHIDPPRDVPDGEYYARIVTIVRPQTDHKAGQSQDARTHYRLPVVSLGPLPIRDSVRVFYRQGPQSMGLKILQSEARIDTSAGAAAVGVGPNPVRILLRVHLTGTAHFEGYISIAYRSESGEETRLTGKDGAAFTLHTDGIMRWSGEADNLDPGHYTAIVTFTERQDEFPPSQRIPMHPVQVKIPFDVP